MDAMLSAENFYQFQCTLKEKEAQNVIEGMEALTEALWWDAPEEGTESDVTVHGVVAKERADLLQSLLKGVELSFSAIEERNWLLETEDKLPPLETRRFYIYGKHIERELKEGLVPLLIESATAFGSGDHETTKGCIALLEELSEEEKIHNALDVGCGSGILSLCIYHLWQAKVLAVDLDPESVRVAAENCHHNGADIAVCLSDGLASLEVSKRAPFDLIVSNLFLEPLKGMAKDMASNLAEGGFLILSGILESQEEALKESFLQHGFSFIKRHPANGWSALLLQK
ncbi:MAG: hypothetical protein K0S07_445 [Chlamydiales bacterium]|jgi:ribosomal protein L11 methyltransferase|nr:hypothetical protein [Chlamydiales bacterium]